MKRAMADPEVRARKSAAMKRAMADPEVRARKSAAMKRAMADPEVRRRLSLQQSARLKALWALMRQLDKGAV
jgi:tripartite-type tricarboxylate transporter receptor subunit TctC